VALPNPTETSTALITGASSGFGVSIARELAQRGHGVTLVARREDRLRELAEELSTQHGVRAEAIGCDLSDPAKRSELISRVAELGLEVEVLVNNAGFGAGGNAHSTAPERLVEMVRLNCEALLDLQARFSPGMAGRGRGAIINIASTAAFQPLPGMGTYAATKAFVLSLSEATHQELGSRGVTVTAVCPGPAKTEFAESGGFDTAKSEASPDLLWLSADQVAKAAVEGAEKGKRVVVPGLLNRAGALAGTYTPRMVLLPVARRAWRQVF
jgi:short-subunit dehydrogenase